MRKLTILKTLLDLAFFGAILTAIALLVFMPMFLIYGEDMVPIKINGQEIAVFDLLTKTTVTFTIIGSFFFIYSIYLLRKTISFFMRRDIFNVAVIRYFKLIGQCLIAYALLTNIPAFVYNAIRRNNIGITFSTGGFDSLLLCVSLGLFFMVLSEVFKIAKTLKEESELTV